MIISILRWSFGFVPRARAKVLPPLVRDTDPACTIQVLRMTSQISWSVAPRRMSDFRSTSLLGEETGDQLAVGGETHASTRGAERFRDRADDADVARAIEKLIVDGGSPAVQSSDLSEGKMLVDGPKNFLFGNRLLQAPGIGIAHVHVFDETHRKSVGSAEFDQRDDFIVVHAANNDGVDLHRIESDAVRREDAGQDAVQIPSLGNLPEPFGIERVQADVDPEQSCSTQGGGAFLPEASRWS